MIPVLKQSSNHLNESFELSINSYMYTLTYTVHTHIIYSYKIYTRKHREEKRSASFDIYAKNCEIFHMHAKYCSWLHNFKNTMEKWSANLRAANELFPLFSREISANTCWLIDGLFDTIGDIFISR